MNNGKENCCEDPSSCPPESKIEIINSDISRRRFLISASTIATGLGLGGSSLWATPQEKESYTKLIQSHKSLLGYWPMNGDLSLIHI